MANLNKLTELKQRLFPNRTTALLIDALGSCDDYFADDLMWPDVRNCLKPGLYKHSEKRDRIINDEMQASRMVMSVIAAYCEDQAGSGILHTYRGILGFEGQNVRAIAESALSYLHEYGWLDYDDYQDRLERLDDRIKGAG